VAAAAAAAAPAATAAEKQQQKTDASLCCAEDGGVVVHEARPQFLVQTAQRLPRAGSHPPHSHVGGGTHTEFREPMPASRQQDGEGT
jgi:hypothetical protein